MKHFSVLYLCVFFIIIFVSLVIYCGKIIIKPCNRHSKNTPSCALFENLKFDVSDQKKGADHIKESSVVICGLARDSLKQLKVNIPMITDIAKLFKKYKILIVENDSQDDTRNYLLDQAKKDKNIYVLGCDGVNLPKCQLNLKKTKDHEIVASRIQKMSFLRNIYLKFIRDHLWNYDYMLVFDFDIEGTIYLDGLQDTFANLTNASNINGITANGIRKHWTQTYYYDPFSIFSKESPSCFKNEKEKRLDEKKILREGLLPSKLKDKFSFVSSHGLIPVKSAFAGLGIYKIAPIIQQNASYDLSCENITCEHTALSESLGNIVINPKMVMYVLEH